eukprot:TRINITY_DN21703_c1_g1_i1.p1 TRINITY_DN21703_c1_g1~~TRINITY_DN21703_c1_g1_i1.p1  ORF type:complete len:661 (-),score=105.91 TRINITY_DN21703_c1_g1_i1:160-2142(-)
MASSGRLCFNKFSPKYTVLLGMGLNVNKLPPQTAEEMDRKGAIETGLVMLLTKDYREKNMESKYDDLGLHQEREQMMQDKSQGTGVKGNLQLNFDAAEVAKVEGNGFIDAGNSEKDASVTERVVFLFVQRREILNLDNLEYRSFVRDCDEYTHMVDTLVYGRGLIAMVKMTSHSQGNHIQAGGELKAQIAKLPIGGSGSLEFKRDCESKNMSFHAIVSQIGGDPEKTGRSFATVEDFVNNVKVFLDAPMTDKNVGILCFEASRLQGLRCFRKRSWGSTLSLPAEVDDTLVVRKTQFLKADMDLRRCLAFVHSALQQNDLENELVTCLHKLRQHLMTVKAYFADPVNLPKSLIDGQVKYEQMSAVAHECTPDVSLISFAPDVDSDTKYKAREQLVKVMAERSKQIQTEAQTRRFKWNERNHGKDLTISRDRLTVQDVSENPGKGEHYDGNRYRAALATEPIAEGRTIISLTINEPGRMLIGVVAVTDAEDLKQATNYGVHMSPNAWTVCFPSGENNDMGSEVWMWHNHAGTRTTLPTPKQNDQVLIIIDSDAKTMRVQVSNQDCSEAVLHDLPIPTKAVYPIVAFGGDEKRGAQVTFEGPLSKSSRSSGASTGTAAGVGTGNGTDTDTGTGTIAGTGTSTGTDTGTGTGTIAGTGTSTGTE